jgi:hypothetical protein
MSSTISSAMAGSILASASFYGILATTAFSFFICPSVMIHDHLNSAEIKYFNVSCGLSTRLPIANCQSPHKMHGFPLHVNLSCPLDEFRFSQNNFDRPFSFFSVRMGA